MTDPEMIEAIAASLGWVRCWPEKNTGMKEWHSTAVSLPNWLESLDACSEFEDSLKGKERLEYVGWIELALVSFKETMNACHLAVFATARQRCAAYLQLKGLWK